MKLKLAFVLVASLASSQALAWNFVEHDVSKRYYEINNRYGSTVTVSDVRCTKTDGRDSLVIGGYFGPTGKWNPINKRLTGANVRKADQYADDVFRSYMKFCADVNRRYK